MSPFAQLQPELVWKHFEALTRVRRPSGEEEQAVAYVKQWAQERGYGLDEDEVGNLIVRVPASKGRESASPVIIQGHLDMVCERDSDSPNDAFEGRLEIVREEDWITAVGTTLGADNGIGVAAGMAAADDPSVQHPVLELLMTIDEETGMTGARGLDASGLQGRMMLNLDSEDDELLFVGCAGGMDTRYSMPFERETPATGSVALRVTVSGLKGGHSGLDIARNRMNAIHALARALRRGGEAADFALSHFEGGKMRNAIPREAMAVVHVAQDRVDAFSIGLQTAADELREQFSGIDEGLEITVEATESSSGVFTGDSTPRLLAFLQAIPSGVISMSQDIAGLVESSTNLGVVRTQDEEIEAVSCSRSSVAPALRMILGQLESIAGLAGVEAKPHGGYPGWKPNLESRALATVKDAYQRLFEEEPAVTAIHAGLECGLIGERVPGMDMVSFGPAIRGAHSPDERVSIPSVQKFYRLLGTVLDDLSKD